MPLENITLMLHGIQVELDGPLQGHDRWCPFYIAQATITLPDGVSVQTSLRYESHKRVFMDVPPNTDDNFRLELSKLCTCLLRKNLIQVNYRVNESSSSGADTQ
jgi:hypothetical protein